MLSRESSPGILLAAVARTVQDLGSIVENQIQDHIPGTRAYETGLAEFQAAQRELSVLLDRLSIDCSRMEVMPGEAPGSTVTTIIADSRWSGDWPENVATALDSLVSVSRCRIPVDSKVADRFVSACRRFVETEGVPKPKASEGSANINAIFPGEMPGNPDIRDLALLLQREHAKPKGERRSDNVVAREFTDETPPNWNKARSLLSQTKQFVKKHGGTL
ncbi:MAG: hypothetical protein HQ582_31710 [Planctomycetes bacterium]|nr:hypothetical protein [Planctomycetota bacterium]